MGIRNQLVAVADEEVGVKTSQVERYVPNAMSTINAAQDPGLLALRRKTLERKAHARHADDRIKEGDLWCHSFTPDLLDQFQEIVDNDIVSAGKLVSNLPSNQIRSCLYQTCYEPLASSINRIKIYDHIASLIDQIPQHDTYSGGCILCKDAFVDWDIQLLCNGSTGGVE